VTDCGDKKNPLDNATLMEGYISSSQEARERISYGERLAEPVQLEA
jgi:hypothetical protein